MKPKRSPVLLAASPMGLTAQSPSRHGNSTPQFFTARLIRRLETHSFPHYIERTALRLSIDTPNILANDSDADQLNATDEQLRNYGARPALDQTGNSKKPV